jgi:hypothetical protein
MSLQSKRTGGTLNPTMRMDRVSVVVFAGCTFAAACSNATGPSPAQVGGHWSGSTNPPSRANVFVIGFTINQTGTSLSGTWGTTSGGGTFDGTIKGIAISLNAKPSRPDQVCPEFAVNGTVAADHIIGTRRLSNACTGRESPIELFRD